MSMSSHGEQRLHGVFPIVSSPFTADGAFDSSALGRLVEFLMRCGVHGAVFPAIASEYSTLSAAERHAGVAAVAETLRDGIPFVVGISDATPARSAEHARQAEAVGAAAVMLMAPREAGSDPDSVADFFRAALDGIAIPVIMQNAPPPLGSSLSVATVREVCRRVPTIRYVKEEVVPCGQRMTALLTGIPSLAGVFGGAGGRFVLDELARGASGSMPACEIPELHVAVFDAFRAGRFEKAREIFNVMLPLLNLGSAYRTPVTKHALVRRGIIGSILHRDSNLPFDAFDIEEFNAIWRRIEPQTLRIGR